MRDIPNWVTPAVMIVGGVLLLKELKKLFDKGKDAGRETGEKISEKLFSVFNPSLSKENFGKPTAVPAKKMMDGNYVCPVGYRHKQLPADRPESSHRAYPGEHWCFRED